MHATQIVLGGRAVVVGAERQGARRSGDTVLGGRGGGQGGEDGLQGEEDSRGETAEVAVLCDDQGVDAVEVVEGGEGQGGGTPEVGEEGDGGVENEEDAATKEEEAPQVSPRSHAPLGLDLSHLSLTNDDHARDAGNRTPRTDGNRTRASAREVERERDSLRARLSARRHEVAMLREEVSKQVQARSAAEKALAEQPLLHLQAVRAMEHELRVRDANLRDLRSTADELLLQAQERESVLRERHEEQMRTAAHLEASGKDLDTRLADFARHQRAQEVALQQSASAVRAREAKVAAAVGKASEKARLQERRLWRRREAELLHALAQERRRAEGERERLREREAALHDMQHLQQAIAIQHEKMRDAEAGLTLRENAVGREEEGRAAWWGRRRAFHVWSAASLVIKGARELRRKVKKRRVTAVLMRAWLHWKQVASNMACFRRGFAAAQAAPSYVRGDGSPGILTPGQSIECLLDATFPPR